MMYLLDIHIVLMVHPTLFHFYSIDIVLYPILIQLGIDIGTQLNSIFDHQNMMVELHIVFHSNNVLLDKYIADMLCSTLCSHCNGRFFYKFVQSIHILMGNYTASFDYPILVH